MATARQKTAISHIVAGDSVSKAMRKAGYSKNTANNPKVLTETPAFIETMEKLGITDEELTKTLKNGLSATKAIVMGKDSGESFVDVVPDHPTRHKFMETGLKLKGYLRNSEPVNNTIVIPILGGITKEVDDVHTDNSTT
jgi:hypothetical protein